MNKEWDVERVVLELLQTNSNFDQEMHKTGHSGWSFESGKKNPSSNCMLQLLYRHTTILLCSVPSEQLVRCFVSTYS